MDGKNYRWNGVYLLTVCTKNRHCFLGKVQDSKIGLSDIGRMAAEELSRMEEIYPSVILDSFVVMPNHVHMLIILTSERDNPTIATIMQQWKGAVTKKAKFPLWQDRFNDKVLYGAAAYRKVKQYIENNPILWKEDRFYAPDTDPDAKGPSAPAL